MSNSTDGLVQDELLVVYSTVKMELKVEDVVFSKWMVVTNE